MKFSTISNMATTALIAFYAFIGLMIAGYVGNIVWLFRNMDTINAEFILAAIGVVVGPLGSLHGIWSWF